MNDIIINGADVSFPAGCLTTVSCVCRNAIGNAEKWKYSNGRIFFKEIKAA